MNKFKLFALAAFAMLSTNALADVSDYVVKDGLIYKVMTEFTKASGSTAAKPGTVQLEGVADNTKGNAIKTAKAVSVPSSIEVTIDDEENTYKVVSANADWETQEISAPKSLSVSGIIETLSINITNFTDALAPTAFDGFTKLATLTIVDNTEVTDKVAAKTTTLPAINATVAALDFENTNITGMGTVTFTGDKLTSVKLSKALKIIPKDAFKDCTKLAGTIKIPATVTIIATDAFNGDVLADFDFSGAAALTNIRANAFRGTGITKLALGNCTKLETIEAGAFKNCEKLTNLVLGGLKDGKKFTTIGQAAFEGTAITAANLPASVTSLGVRAFANCEELTALSAMAGLTAIPDEAFLGDVKLASVKIAKGVASIGESAFEGCKKLATVTIMTDDKDKSALAAIGYGAFANCEALTAIDLSKTKIKKISSPTGTKLTQFAGCKSLATILLPETLEAIGKQAFGDCVIEDLDLSKTEMTKVYAMFQRGDETYPSKDKPYASLQSIKLPEKLEVIYDYSMNEAGVFQYCTGLTEITIPEGVTYIPSFAFQYCTALETATVSDGVVDEKAFWYCDKLKTFNYLDTDITNDDADFVDDNAFLGCSNSPFIKFVTTGTYQKAHPTAPTNTKYGTSANATMKTVWEGVEGAVKAYGIFENTTGNDVIVKKSDDLKLYSIYVDEGIAYFQALRTFDGQFIIAPNAHVILKTDAPKDNIEYTTATESGKNSVLVDEVVTLNWGGDLYDYQISADPTCELADFRYDNGIKASQYVYRLTNNGGFGFKFFTGTTMKAGQFFIVSTKKPTGAARLQTVWLDENGNVEGDATGIQQVDAAEAQDGAIYNLQGVRVNAAKKGLYIQNGKKFIVK